MSDEGEVIALAGVFQAARMVVELAHEGRCDAAAFDACLQSVLRIDASSPAAVFGGLEGVRSGLAGFSDLIEGRGTEAGATRIAVTVLHLERKLARRKDMLDTVRKGVEKAALDVGRGDLDTDGLADRLGGLYGETVSQLKPRVIVQGNGLHLSQPAVVARIRAALLAAIRAAVLWRQLGGTHWRLFFGRRRLAARAAQLYSTLSRAADR